MRRSWTILVALAVSASFSAPTAAQGVWSPYGPPVGTVLDLAIGPAGELFVAPDHGAVYVSRDHGASWAWSGLGMGTERVRALAVDRSDGALYASGESSVFRSRDAGASWQTLATGLDLGPLTDGYSDLLQLAGSPVTLYLARGTRLLRGTAGGTAWRPLLVTPTLIGSFLADPTNPRSLFVGTVLPGALFHSADGGVTWSRVRAVDRGSEDPPFDNPFYSGVFDLKAVPGSPTALVAGVADGYTPNLFRSLDGGATWHAVPAMPPGSFEVSAIAVDPGPPATLFVLSSLPSTPAEPAILHGLFASQDVGATWRRVGTSEVIVGELRIDPASGDFYNNIGPAIGHGAAGGARWTYVYLNDPAAVGQGCSYEMRVRFPRHSTSQVYAMVNCELFRSDDGGASWRPPPATTLRGLPASPAVLGIFDVAVDPLVDDLLVAATAHGVMSTADGGITWRSLLPQPSGGSPLRVVAIGSHGTLLAGGCGIFVSADRGEHWRQTYGCDQDPRDVAVGVTRFVVDPAQPEVIFAEAVAASGQDFLVHPLILRSTNSGETWRVFFSAANRIAVDPRKPDRLFVLGPQGVWGTENGGESWREISDFALGAADQPDQGDLAVDLFDRQVLWATRPDGVWESGDAGVSWQSRSDGLRGRPALELFLNPHRPGEIVIDSDALFAASFPSSVARSILP